MNRWSIAAVVASLVTFVWLTWLAWGDSVLARDVDIARAVQAWDFPGIVAIFRLTNWLMHGTPATVMIVLLFLILAIRRSWWEALVVAGTLPLRLINGQIKEIVASPRPTADLVQIDGSFDGYGYPSGHTTAAVLICGVLAWLITRRTDRRIRRAAVWILAVGWVGLTALGRIRIGAHWPSDTLGSALWSGPTLAILIGLTNVVKPALQRNDPK